MMESLEDGDVSESKLWITDAETLSKVKDLKMLQFHFD